MYVPASAATQVPPVARTGSGMDLCPGTGSGVGATRHLVAKAGDRRGAGQIVGGEFVAIDAQPSDAIALALGVRAPIFAEDTVIDNAKQLHKSPATGDSERLQTWLEAVDPEELGKYKM